MPASKSTHDITRIDGLPILGVRQPLTPALLEE